MATFSYSADNVFLSIGGFPISGIQDGSDISISMDSEVMTKQVDVDGKNVVFNKTNNNTATITFTLNDGADANDYLSVMYQAFKNNVTGGILPVFLKDNNTGTTFLSGSCCVQSLPDITVGRESSGREWVMATGQSELYIGGANTAI